MITQAAFAAANGSHVVAEGGGGREVLANRGGIGPWESFRVFNRTRPGEGLRHGDELVLQAWNGRFVSALHGGGASVNAALEWIDPTAVLKLERVAGAGAVRNGDQVALRAPNGNYFIAIGGGGGPSTRTAGAGVPWKPSPSGSSAPGWSGSVRPPAGT